MLPDHTKEVLGTFMLISSHQERQLRKFAKLYCVTAGYSRENLPEKEDITRKELDNTMYDLLFNKNKLVCILTIKKYFPSFRLGTARRHE
jgi:hypothetical protein